MFWSTNDALRENDITAQSLTHPLSYVSPSRGVRLIFTAFSTETEKNVMRKKKLLLISIPDSDWKLEDEEAEKKENFFESDPDPSQWQRLAVAVDSVDD